MTSDAKHAYRALVARDARFDGLFFVGVSTTGIYRRPICPARTPREDRCAFFNSAVLAEREGYCACFRCRPELALGSASVDALSRLAMEASARIDAGALDHGGSVETLADSPQVSSRHLRRVLKSEVGVPPRALAQSRRLARAKLLFTDTQPSMAQIAFVSGFGSVRRFNDAFQKRFGGPPQRLGRAGATASETGPLTLKLAYRAPFDWQMLIGYLAPRAIPQLEEVQGDVLRRLVHIEGNTGLIEVRHKPEARQIWATVDTSLALHIRRIAIILRHISDLDADPGRIAALPRCSRPRFRNPFSDRPGCVFQDRSYAVLHLWHAPAP